MPNPPLGRPARRSILAGALTAVADFLLPPVCAACVRRLHEDEYGLCRDCRALVESPRGPLCPHCGRSFPKKPKPDGRCASCAHLPRDGFDAARAAFLYTGPMVEAVHQLKYYGHEELAECLGRWLFLFWREQWPDSAEIDAIVPVPLHCSRYWRRGFNQSESLARVLARWSDVDLATHCLQRTRRTRSQTRVETCRRLENVADAFRVTHAAAVEHRRILLVDDVMTTGATLSSAARALRLAGASTVWALTVARAV